MVNKSVYLSLQKDFEEKKVSLVAVSKLKSVADIKELYDIGHKDFGENYVQELVEKAASLPQDIHWHYIGHLQRNKVKYIASFVHLIHGVDSLKLLQEINKQAAKNNRVIDCLLQVFIADEETKFGFDSTDLAQFETFYDANKDSLSNVRIRGMMGMASFSEDEEKVKQEFKNLKNIFEIHKGSTFLFDKNFNILSMGMSGDYPLAIAEGSTMVRIGSLIFGRRLFS
ncbi:MAG TPA: YggS family pyridoxal phosphate-dependent enzyme [Edaphocola sp.]|nr:YggS family pyridoxal phosphate-dependent enzyme [Edaphocola sp.]